MKTELDQQLVSKYPNLFTQYGGNTWLTFGIECGDGWYSLIDTLCGAIQGEVNWVNRLWPELNFSCSAVQVTEKYGCLRFYYEFFYTSDLSTDQMIKLEVSMNRIAGMTIMTEAISKTTCENCGVECTQGEGMYARAECNACETLRRDAYDSTHSA